MTIETVLTSVKKLYEEAKPSDNSILFASEIIQIVHRELKHYVSPKATKKLLEAVENELTNLWEENDND